MSGLIDLNRLSEPFPSNDIEWRVSQCGEKNGKPWAMCVAYISARAIMDRLDSVVGPQNWKAEYNVLPGGVMCNLSIKCGENEWVCKQDGAEQTEIESFKGGISSALKRAGSVWGIGRYLYKLESAFAKIVDQGTEGAYYASTKDKKPFYWLPPTLPLWALPKCSAPALPVKESAAPVPPVNKVPATREVLISEIMKEATRIGCPESELISWCEDQFKKPTKNLTESELSEFLNILGREPSKAGVV